ncbi:hypothetical protein SS1G_06291 [Sclerotinia sclerotiorum 1980 UF-70]|uniref:HTH psq-type domain-containing protein n=2 Tax=Sclerotinia sclerotiorum (strain ATCC 18683 / 1980 / Ss-1) TaxID=665079 RepID=A7ELU4_SCLS1|nr:hypothetical protein SS1G_06291 [Sclerotinia sclerotiorum 1980 UF-70]APA09566.1 hypothetical protein sscle_05g043360 [Sclerotinia sclerotiorum 1980 UF-70]EDO03810.1 hypothetical protein SS1G_06291 [Sclerotinia sclerotiorum 1980 UF-70]
MVSTLNERDIVIAMKAMAKDKNLSLWKAVKIYNITHTTLIRRMKEITPASEYRQKQYKITKIKEEVIIQHIIDMDERGFSPKFISVESMANHILESRGGKRVGIQPDNRKWSTAIVCGDATGENIPLYLLVQGQMHLANWYNETDMPPE